jgi:hypothetical protein
MGALVFATAGVDWRDLEAFVANPDFENPPAVAEVTGVGLDTAGSGVGYGEVEQGPLGLACAFGSFEEPTFRLCGPFEVAGWLRPRREPPRRRSAARAGRPRSPPARWR